MTERLRGALPEIPYPEFTGERFTEPRDLS